MNHSALIGSTLLGLMVSTSVLAQNSLGELLDGGGKKLSKTELVATLAGSGVSGKNKMGANFEVTFKPDGTYTGSAQSAQGYNGNLYGTWTVDEGGKLCTESTTSLSFGKVSTCGFFYNIEDAFFFCESDTDRGALLLKRTIKKG